MKIEKVKQENIFLALLTKKQIVCVDFKRGTYIDLSGQTVEYIQRLIRQPEAWFFSITDETGGEA